MGAARVFQRFDINVEIFQEIVAEALTLLFKEAIILSEVRRGEDPECE